jgi:hypothetical protein
MDPPWITFMHNNVLVERLVRQRDVHFKIRLKTDLF